MTFRTWIESRVNRIGSEIAARHSLVRGKAWNQTTDNCYEVAKEVAEMFGYLVPSKMAVQEIARNQIANGLWGGSSDLMLGRSEAFLVIRESPGDGFLSLHVYFERRGKEYNYGVLGGKLIAKIPLKNNFTPDPSTV